jgi:23S rRNA (guanosine2251-2'-O)-methyltransferase
MKKTDLIYGIHASVSALNNKKRDISGWKCTKEVFEKIKKKIDKEIISKSKIVDRKHLDNELQNKFHQGIFVECKKMVELNFDEELKKNNSTILILDSLTDSQNVGAIIRSAFLFGITLIIYNENNSFDINSTLIKSASGAYENVRLLKVMNLNNTIKILKNEGYWVVGLDSDSNESLSNVRKDTKKVLILGSEGKGIRDLVKKNCDYLIKIPMVNKNSSVDSLNVSSAASIIFYELSRYENDW